MISLISNKYRLISNSNRLISRMYCSFKDDVRKINDMVENCEIYEKVHDNVSNKMVNYSIKRINRRDIIRENEQLKRCISELRNENRELRQFLLERFY